MFVEILDVPLGKIGESAQGMIDRAVTEARRRGHGELTSGHLFVAFAQVEWSLFADIMRLNGALVRAAGS